MFWVDKTITDILKRQEKKYLITDYKTPSGKIHVGALRGVIIHDVIARGLREKNQSVEFRYGFDDFDPMDSLPAGLMADFQQYMGMPLCKVPSPEKNKNFAQYYVQGFINVINSLGVDYKIVWAFELYKAGVYNKAIEIVLNNASQIRQIYQEVSGSQKPKDWYPLHVVCPQCGKIGTTKVTAWDGQEVQFECLKDLVSWAQGCGLKGKISPFDGQAKLPYKVETPAKWFTFKTSVELAGKDHYTKGGSFDIARAIAEKVFQIKPAYGYGYEWFLVGGKKMSTSQGVGASSEDIAGLVAPELLRFLMVRTRAKRAIDFDPFGDTIPVLYDEYDRCRDVYLEDPLSDLGRAFYFSELDLKKDIFRYSLRFSKIAYMLQMPRADIGKYATREKGSKLTEAESQEIDKRQAIAKKWLKTYAPENFKFTIQETLPSQAKDLNNLQKQFLSQITALIESKDQWQGEDLHQELHRIKTELKISPREAFSAIYQIFIGKDSGPQAGWLLAALDKDFVIKRISQVIK